MFVDEFENDCVPYLLELHNLYKKLGFEHELVLAINGAGRFNRSCLERWPEEGPELRVVELTRHVPSGVCLQTVLPECRGTILTICGPYRQIADTGLVMLLQAVASGSVDLALPWRRQRVDPMINQFQSRMFNRLVRQMTGAEFHDFSSTLRVVHRTVLEETPLYGDLYRYLPILAKRRGFKVKEFPAIHSEERGRVGYYGVREYVSRLVDLLVMRFNLKFVRKPLRYFGLRGLLLVLFGLSCLVYAAIMKIVGRVELGNSPVLMIGLVLMLAGSGIWGIGLLGEIMTFTLGRKHKDYIVDRILD